MAVKKLCSYLHIFVLGFLCELNFFHVVHLPTSSLGDGLGCLGDSMSLTETTAAATVTTEL